MIHQENTTKGQNEENGSREEEPVLIPDEEAGGLPEEKIRMLKARLAQCEKERLEYLGGWQRAKADFINARREDEKARKDIFSLAQETILQSFLPVADSFTLAFADKEAWGMVNEKWRKGVEQIYAQLTRIFRELGLTEFSPLGELFNPALHESVESVPTEKESEHNTIIAVLQNGYTLDGKIVRPAKVKVGEHFSNSPKA